MYPVLTWARCVTKKTCGGVWPHTICRLWICCWTSRLARVGPYKRNLLQRPTIEDEVYAHFVSDSGVPISVRVSWLSPTKRHEVVITGSRKMAIFEDTLPDGQELKLIDYQFEQDGQRVGGIQQGLPELVDYEPAGNLLARQRPMLFSGGAWRWSSAAGQQRGLRSAGD